ncbi:MAG: hypothetical protein ACK4RV_10145 [Caulobacter sp.]
MNTDSIIAAANRRMVLDDQGVAFDPDSLPQVLAYDGSGNLTSITVTEGPTVRVQTLTYTNGKVTGISQWVVQ